MTSPLYSVELFCDKIAYDFVFEILPTLTLNKNEVPIRIVKNAALARGVQGFTGEISLAPLTQQRESRKSNISIRESSDVGGNKETGNAVAYVFEWEYGGTTLTSIHFNGKTYHPDVYTNYWFPFPLVEKPEELVDGSMRVYSNMGTVFLTPLDTMPFMDANGTFYYEYRVVSNEVKTNHPIEVILFQIGNDYKLMVDKTTRIAYSIDRVFTFREMSTVHKFDKYVE